MSPRHSIYRIYRDEVLLLREIARRAGVSKDCVERAARLGEDVTERVERCRMMRDRALVAQAFELSAAIVRMRRHRGWDLHKALTTPVRRAK